MWKVWRALALISEWGFLSYWPFDSSDRYSVHYFQINEHTLYLVWPSRKIVSCRKDPGILVCTISFSWKGSSVSASLWWDIPVLHPHQTCAAYCAVDTMFPWQLTERQKFSSCVIFPMNSLWYLYFGLCLKGTCSFIRDAVSVQELLVHARVFKLNHVHSTRDKNLPFTSSASGNLNPACEGTQAISS